MKLGRGCAFAAVRKSVHEALGFSPFELVFGHVTWRPLKFLKEAWLDVESSDNVSIGGAP